MQIKITPFIALWIAFFSMKVMADETHERMYLTQIVNQLSAIKPLIVSANHEQVPDTRIKFHYSAYRDANNTLHNGLLEDINEIQKGIEEKLNQKMSEPRHFVKIRGDYAK
jgi:RAQPRD family integrative conjugative element protein